LRRIARGETGKLHHVEQLADPPRDLAPAWPQAARPDDQAVGDVVEHRHVAEQGVGLEDESDPPLLHRQPRRVVVAKAEPAAVGFLEAGDDAQQRGLATAGGPEQRDELARRDCQVDPCQDRLVAEALADAGDLDALAGGAGRLGRTAVIARLGARFLCRFATRART
jgi:hypothetical protein